MHYFAFRESVNEPGGVVIPADLLQPVHKNAGVVGQCSPRLDS